MQQLIVIIIGVAVFSYTLYKIYKTVVKSNSNGTKCGGCDGCSPISEV
ncbi:MAG: FeoB-associated Cys-rich membrane protein [Porphyromonadaceae bacterium]|nr:FeoB-associated Cys-rich membrane protein [Porphyromonadaceae bacterium]